MAVEYCEAHHVINCLDCFPRPPKDVPEEEIIAFMEARIKEGWICYVKWTCEKCGARCASNTPNTFNKGGYKHEECGHTSSPKGYGVMTYKGPGAVGD